MSQPAVRQFRAWLAAEDWFYGKLLGSCLAGVSAIVLLGAIFLTVAQRERRSDKLRETTFRIFNLADKVESDLTRLESDQGESLPASGRLHLDPFKRHGSTLQKRLAEFAGLVAHDSKQSQVLERMRHSIAVWQKRVAAAPDDERTETPQAQHSSPPPDSQTLLDGVRFDLTYLSRLAAQKYDQSNRHARRLRNLETGGFGLLCLLAISFLGASSWYSFTTCRRQLAKAASAQAQTRSIIATTLDGVLTFDENGSIASINPAAERMFGQTAADLVGEPVSLLILGGTAFTEAAPPSHGTRMAVGQRCGGTPFPIELSLSEMVQDARRQFVAIIRDVTERKRNEEILRHIGLGVSAATGEEFVKSLVCQLSRALQSDYAFVVQVGREAGQTSILTLAERGDLHSCGSFDLEHTACAEVLKGGFRAWLSGARTRFTEDALLAGLEIESFIALPLAGHDGRPIGVMGVLHRAPTSDVPVVESTLQIFAARAAAEVERKRFEDELAAEKDRLAITLRSIGEGFIATDGEGRVLMLNQIAERFTGWTQEQAAGRPLTDIFHLLDERTRRRCLPALNRLIQTGNAGELGLPTLMVAPDGSERLVETSAAPIGDSIQRRAGVVLVFRDVTERQRADEERRKAEKLESLGVAAGGIAHDFNNLLTAILGNLSLALYTPLLDQHLSDRLTSAKKASLRAQELAQQLLTFAKGGAPIKQTTSIAELVTDTVSFSLRGSSVRCEYDVPHDLWAADVDAGQISQVITNLTVNAEQAMPAGGTLRVGTANFALSVDNPRLGLPAGRYIKITLQDEGIGIPEEYIKKIFDPYFTTKPKGSGLGLATSYSIIKNHHGVIDVISQPGEGTTFYLFLRASDRDVMEPTPDDHLEAPVHNPARVLVLDDEEDICALVACALEPHGYEVTQTTDAVTAIRSYKEALHDGRPFDLVISDLTIPGGMGGQEAVRRLREIDPQVKAIVSSGYAMDPVMSSYREHGFCGMIAKPYEIDALERIVAQVLTKHNGGKVIHHIFEERKTA